MRRYDIVSRIILILSIIDFALAAPVLVQEKHQARVDVVHIPRDMITVLEKRGGAAENLVEFFKTLGKVTLFDSSESDTPLSLSSTASYENGLSDSDWGYDANDGWHESISMHTPTSTDGDYGPYHELAGTPPPSPRPSTEGDYGSSHELAGAPAPNPRPSTEGDYGPYHELAAAPASKEFDQTDEDRVEKGRLPSPPSNPAQRSLDPEG
jgi:hypothetical protein